MESLLKAEIERLAAVLGFRFALYSLNVLFYALRATHNAIGPAHLLDVG